MSLLRAFIAIEIPPEIKKAITVQTASLQAGSGHAVRWVAPENIHLTIKFLGEISPNNLELLSAALQAECAQHPPFEISVGSLGCFPNARHARVIWIGLEVPPDLNRLQRNIEAATARLGYATEDKPFAPHLTIGRVREQASPAEIQSLRTALEKNQIDQLGSFTVSAVHLFKSDLRPGGPIYTRLFSAPIQNPK